MLMVCFGKWHDSTLYLLRFIPRVLCVSPIGNLYEGLRMAQDFVGASFFENVV